MENNPTKLDLTNPDALIYENELLKLTVLGGIKLEGLDRMRATLKVELRKTSIPPVRHNLDLYNDNQTEKLIRKVAEKLEIGTSVIAASLAELTGQLEEYRLHQLQENQPKPFEPPRLSNEERKAAETFLKSKDLLKKTNQLIGESGVVGEEINRLIMFVIFTSRKRSQPLHVVNLGSSGTGKTHLQEKVGELIPPEDKIELTTLSENAFYYFGQRELKHKLILIEDLDGAENVLYPLRELQSKKRISKTIAHKNTKGETKPLHLVVEGPVSVSGCTTKEELYEDNANRSFLLYLDESEAQDTRIMEYQRAASAGQVDEQGQEIASELLRNAQRLLEPIKVINPFAPHLQISKEVFKPRRTNNHYLQFIEAVTFYHQFQRPLKADDHGEAYIETTVEDIQAANELLKGILLRKSDELTGACRDHLDRLKEWVRAEGKTHFGNRETSRKLRKPISTIKRYHYQLVELGYLRSEKQKDMKKYTYRLTELAHDETRSQTIERAMEQALHAIGISSTGSVTAQSTVEPPKQLKTRRKKTTAQKS